MLHIIQAMAYMWNGLEYTEHEIAEIFQNIEEGELSVEDLLSTIGMEVGHPAMLKRMKDCVPKWRSALTVVKLRSE